MHSAADWIPTNLSILASPTGCQGRRDDVPIFESAFVRSYRSGRALPCERIEPSGSAVAKSKTIATNDAISVGTIIPSASTRESPGIAAESTGTRIDISEIKGSRPFFGAAAAPVNQEQGSIGTDFHEGAARCRVEHLAGTC